MNNTDKVEAILSNEKEWRRYMMEEIKEIKNSQIEMRISVSDLKTKVAFFGAIFGAVGSFLTTYIKSKISHL